MIQHYVANEGRGYSSDQVKGLAALMRRFGGVAERASKIAGPGRQDAEQALRALAGSYDGRRESAAGIVAALSELSRSIDGALEAERNVRAAVERPVRNALEERKADELESAKRDALLLIQEAQERLRLDAQAAQEASRSLDADGEPAAD